MAKDVKKYKVTIAGESYFLVSDESEERIKRVAQHVDDHMRLVAQTGHSDDPQRLAVLVALQSTSKMMEYSELIKAYQESHEKLIEDITQETASSEASVVPV